MTNFLTLPNRYPGLLRMAKFIGPYFPSPFSKNLKHTKPYLFGNYPSTVLFSNKPLKIQIPQITDF